MLRPVSIPKSHAKSPTLGRYKKIHSPDTKNFSKPVSGEKIFLHRPTSHILLSISLHFPGSHVTIRINLPIIDKRCGGETLLMIPYYENKFRSLYASAHDSLYYPPHLHNLIECVYVRSGEIDIRIDNEEKHMRAGEMAVIFPNAVHSYQSEKTTGANFCEYIFCPVKTNSRLYGLIREKKRRIRFFFRMKFTLLFQNSSTRQSHCAAAKNRIMFWQKF